MAARKRASPRRADALRNIETIVLAAQRRLARDPDASMSDIAGEAGLGRITIYGHFKSRAELVEVVTRRVLADANALLGGVDLRGDADSALARLVQASWEVTARAGSLLIAAERALPPQTLRELHAGELEERVRRFVAHGQREGAFRSDFSTDWLVTLFHATLHSAVSEVHAGRLDAKRAAETITQTLRSTYQAPSKHRPRTRRASGRRA